MIVLKKRLKIHQIQGLNIRNNIEYSLMGIAIVMAFGIHFSSLMPVMIYYIMVIASLVTGWLGIAVYLAKRNISVNLILAIWLILIVYMVFIGFFQSGFGHYDISEMGSQDLRYVMYIAIGLIMGYSEDAYSFYTDFMYKICFVIIILSIISICTYDYNMLYITGRGRGYLWSFHYYVYWCAETLVRFCFVRSVFTKEKRLEGIAIFSIFMIYSTLFVKRASLLNAVLLVFLCILGLKRENKLNKIRVFSFVLLLIFGSVLIMYALFSRVPYFHQLVLRMMERMSVSISSGGDGRLEEVQYYIQNASITEMIFGQGIGRYIYKEPRTINAIHVGFYDLFYRGGIPLFLFWVLIGVQAIKKWLGKKEISTETTINLVIIISVILEMGYGMSWTYSALPIGFATSIGYIFRSSKGTTV